MLSGIKQALPIARHIAGAWLGDVTGMALLSSGRERSQWGGPALARCLKKLGVQSSLQGRLQVAMLQQPLSVQASWATWEGALPALQG